MVREAERQDVIFEQVESDQRERPWEHYLDAE